MKITIKTLDKSTFTFDVASAATVAHVKELIGKERDWVPAQMKLIFSGRVLKDEDTLEGASIKENDFLVVMYTKPKPPLPQSSMAKPAASSPKLVKLNDEKKQPPASNEASNAPSSSAAAPVSGGVDAMMKNMRQMGFVDNEIKFALEAAQNDPNRAIELLLSNFPGKRGPNGAAAAAAAASSSLATTPAPVPASRLNEAANSGPDEIFQHLDGSPQFIQLRRLLQNNPQALEPFLLEIGQTNPEMLQFIYQNQADFLQLLNAPELHSHDHQAGGGATIAITPEENEAIVRLTDLGFSREMAAQAYFACEKDENAAANFLFEHGNNL